ncbi:MAG: glutathione S-transferase family protein [Betaproteobacteria bacterium]
MLRLWGRLSSINVRKVEWAAREVGVPFERIDAGGSYGGLDTPAALARNPNRMIPVLDDDGFVLWESNAIVRYLCARYAPDRLYPLDLKRRFDAERWMDWQQTTLNPAGRGAFMQLIRTPAERRDATAVEASRAATEPLLVLLDRHLAGRRFVAGEDFTMADIPVGCEVHRWFNLPLARPALPNLYRWYGELRERPAATVLAIALS